jgi:tetratricopeptide (TPR) repeat protein
VADAELLVDLDSGTQSGAAGLESPIGAAELEDLRWYLEDYLQTPFGVYSDRGSRIAGRLAGWGRSLFDSALGTGQAGMSYADLRARGLAEIVVRSGAPERLGLPWELMRAPDSSAPLVLDGIGITRCLAARAADDPVDAAGERLRVLMVISRPAGVRDVGYQMIARPLLRSMMPARGEVDLEVLRPPTLEALAARLREARDAGASFQVVHFDGHGVAAGEGALVFERPGGGADYVTAGRLAEVLTTADVSVAVLNACQSGAIGKRLEASIATGLLSGDVSAVVAMSYRVYAVAAAKFMTAFYDRLLSGGTIGEAVRAGRSGMARHQGRPSPKGQLPLEDWAVPVYYRRREVRFPQLRAVPALVPGVGPAGDRGGDPLAPEEEFVGRDDLFCTLETAARTDRVVVLYGPGGAGKTELAKAFGRWWRDTGGVDRPDGVFWHSFEPGVPSLGLDGAILQAGLRLCGPGFALQDPGTRRDLVLEQLRTRRLLLVWDNFESVASMPGDVTPGLDETPRTELKSFLHEAAAHGQSTILVTSRTPESWLGNVRRLAVGGLLPPEAVEYADQVLAPFPAAAARRADRSFAELLEWLDGHPLSMRLILPHLATTGPAALIAGLQGTEPLPAAEEDTAAEDDARTRSLTASIGYSVVHLSPAGRRLLVALSLLRAVADAEILGAFSAQQDAPQRLRGVSADEWDVVLGEAARVGLLTTRADGGYDVHPVLPAYLAAQWRSEEPAIYLDARAAADRALLAACAAASGRWGNAMEADASTEAAAFLDRNRRTMGRMLGYALDNRQWDAAEPIFSTLYQHLDSLGRTEEARGWLDRARGALEGPGGVQREEPHEIVAGLGRREETPSALPLRGAVSMAQGNMHRRAGEWDAAEACYREFLRAGESGAAMLPEEKRPRAIFALAYGKLGYVAEERGQLAKAEEMYQKAIAEAVWEGSAYPDWGTVAGYFRNLGSVARKRGRWDEAENHCRKSLAILEESGGSLDQAQYTYDDLAHLAVARHRLDEAEDWFGKSLLVAEQRHDEEGMSRSYQALGVVARQRGNLEEAEQWYRRSLTMAENVRARRRMAASYHELGTIAMLRGQVDDAWQWVRASLAIHQEIGDRSGICANYLAMANFALRGRELDEAERLLTEALAIEEGIGRPEQLSHCYHLLASVAHEKGQRDETERWIRRALPVDEDMGDEAGVAQSYGQLAELAEARGELTEALDWTIRSVALSRRLPRFPHDHDLTLLLGRLTARLGTGLLEERWERVTGDALPADVRQRALPDPSEDEPQADG